MYPDYVYETRVQVQRTPEQATVALSTNDDVPVAGKVVIGAAYAVGLAASLLVPLAAWKYLRS